MSLRRLFVRLGQALIALVLLVVVGAHLVPLPASPDRDAADLLPAGARLLDVAGEAVPVMGAGESAGPAVLLVHGFGGSTFSWRLTVPALAAAGYRAVALDLANFGLSEKRWEADTSHPAQARRVLAVMDALGIEEATLVGHSMGGNVILHVAMLAPERVRALILVDAAAVRAGQGSSPGGGLASAALQVPPLRQVARQTVRRVVDDDRLVEMLSSAYADPGFVSPEIAEGYLAQIQTRDWDLALLAVVRDSGRNALPAELGTLDLPVQVIWGAQDPWIPLAAGEALRNGIPGARLDVIEEAGHLPFEEQPEAFMTRLLRFLDQAAAGREPVADGQAAPGREPSAS